MSPVAQTTVDADLARLLPLLEFGREREGIDLSTLKATDTQHIFRKKELSEKKHR